MSEAPLFHDAMQARLNYLVRVLDNAGGYAVLPEHLPPEVLPPFQQKQPASDAALPGPVAETKPDDTDASIRIRRDALRLLSSRRLLDSVTLRCIQHPCVGLDGNFYEEDIAARLVRSSKLEGFIRLRAGQGEDPDVILELLLDPIHMVDLVEPVLANDGYLYNKSTAEDLMAINARGAGGVELTRFVAVPSVFKWPRELEEIAQ